MKITVFLLLMGLMQVSANSVAQKINLSMKNASLQEAIEQLRKQSGYNFLYIKKDVLSRANPVNAQLNNATIEEALARVFTSQPLVYEIKDRTVIIKTPSLPVVIATRRKAITGKVTDEKGETLVGVSIVVKGTKIGAVTNSDGAYTIQANPGSVLIFSYVGYQTKEVTVGSDGTVNVSLLAIQDGLDEVVVVGYGTQKKETLTGSIASISTKEIKQSPAANLAVTLAGRLPGLTAIQRSGEPGRDVTELFIRGQGTINAQSPIVLVDGVERELTYIDPNEVESITILKDASSTAIFGVRGANGVILITTKRGTSEIPEINVSAETGMEDMPRLPSLISSYDYARTRNLAQRNDGLGDAYSAEALEHYRLGDDPLRYPNTDWKNIILKDHSRQDRYNLNVSGIAKAVKYFVNAGYLNQGGIFKTEKNLSYDPSFKLDRYNFRSNIDIQLNKSLRALLNLGGYLEKQNMPGGIYGNADVSPAVNILAQLAIDQNATVPGPLTPDGEVSVWQGGFYPPFGQLNRAGYVQQSRNNITATFGLSQDLGFLTKGLSVKAQMSFDSKSINNLMANREYLKLVQVIEPNAEGGENIYYRNMGDSKNTPLVLSGSRSVSTLSNFQGYLYYTNSVDKHVFTGLMLYQQQQSISNSSLPYSLRGIASRLTYGYDYRFFAEFNMGYNGSEQFKKGQRFGFFPAFSGAWLVSNEKFLKESKLINLLKVRASYGKVGNDRLGSRRFLYLDDVQLVGGGHSSSLGLGQMVNTNLLKNENLQWEVAKKTNIGLDIGLFNAIDITVDVFKERRDNILRNRGTIPILNGLPVSILPPVNIGIVENKGFEVELRYKKRVNNDLSVMGKLNVNYASNKQLFADEPELDETYAYRFRETGYRIGQNFGYVVDRYFTSEDDVANSPIQNVPGHASKPGDFKYVDMNHDGVINEKDIAPIGYSVIPEYQFGAAFNIAYKGFDLSVLVQGVTNVHKYYNSWGIFAMGNNYRDRHLESWTAERFANGEQISYPRLTTVLNPNENANSFFINDGSYIRLKNVEIGYTLPDLVAKKIGAHRIRVYSNGLNLVTWDKLPVKDYDPELAGILTYPISRIFNFGLNLTF